MRSNADTMSRSVRTGFRGLRPTDDLAQVARSWCQVLSSGTSWDDAASWDVLIDQSYSPLRQKIATATVTLHVKEVEVQAVADDPDPYAALRAAFLTLFERLRAESWCELITSKNKEWPQ